MFASILFKDLSEEDIRKAFDVLIVKKSSFQKNDIIFLQNEDMKYLGYINAGEVAVTRLRKSGERAILNILKQGEIFGEAAALAKQKIAPATIMALTKCEIFYLNIEFLFSNDCGLEFKNIIIKNILETLASRTLFLNKRLAYLEIKSIRGKLSTFLHDEYLKHNTSSFQIMFNRNELAEFLNVSRPSMSRELKNMSDDGLITFKKNKFKILDIESLEYERN